MRLPAVWLVALVGLSALVRNALAARVPSPWLLPDEIVYSELAKSIAEGSRPSIRGVPVFGWGEVYPTLIAPAWMLFDDPVWAYHAALVINTLVMSLAAVPAYLVARMFVPRTLSFVVAVMTVLVPSMAYTGIVMTENAFYPVFLLSVWLIARAVRTPTLGAQALALAGLGLVVATRIQGCALIAAYVGAVVVYAATAPRSQRWAYLRRYLPSVALALLAAIAPFVTSAARGNGPFGWLGARSGTFDGFRLAEIPQWLAFLVADLSLYVAVAPALATTILVIRGLRRESRESTRLFAAIALPTLAAMLVSVSVVSASFDVDGTENLNERYVFYVVPLLFLGLALWIREELPRPRPWASLSVGGCCLLAALLPVERLGYNAGFQSLALLPWLGLDTAASTGAVLVLAFALACGGFWLTCPPTRVGYLFLISAVWMSAIGAMAVVSNANSAANSATAIKGRVPNWVDDAVPDGAAVAVLWDQDGEGRATLAEFRLMVTEFFNPKIREVYRIGGPTYYESFLPTVPVVVRPDRRVIGLRGTTIEPHYVLVSCTTAVTGQVIASSPHGSFDLVDAARPLRLSGGRRCPDGS